MNDERSLVLFAGDELVATGGGAQMARTLIRMQADGDTRTFLAFNDKTGVQVDVDLRDATSQGQGTDTKTVKKAGRPKLGVTSHEVTLLPRHWEWLRSQPGGASATLRKLVEKARREGEAHDRVRRSQGAAHSFMAAIAGNQPGYEEALRALYAGDGPTFSSLITKWPADVRDFIVSLASEAFAG